MMCTHVGTPTVATRLHIAYTAIHTAPRNSDHDNTTTCLSDDEDDTSESDESGGSGDCNTLHDKTLGRLVNVL